MANKANKAIQIDKELVEEFDQLCGVTSAKFEEARMTIASVANVLAARDNAIITGTQAEELKTLINNINALVDSISKKFALAAVQTRRVAEKYGHVSAVKHTNVDDSVTAINNILSQIKRV